MNAKNILILAVVAFSLLLNSCNTFRGVGQDFQRVGRGINNVSYGQPF